MEKPTGVPGFSLHQETYVMGSEAPWPSLQGLSAIGPSHCSLEGTFDSEIHVVDAPPGPEVGDSAGAGVSSGTERRRQSGFEANGKPPAITAHPASSQLLNPATNTHPV